MSQSLIIADNHPLFRTGVRQIIDESRLFEVLAEVGDGESCIFQVKNLNPDCLVLDLNLPGKNGFDVARELQQLAPDCRIIILSMHSSSEFVEEARRVGCRGFVGNRKANQTVHSRQIELVADVLSVRVDSSLGKVHCCCNFPTGF